ncbi:hypothetical protein [Streptomyces yerevanensis]|uniref:hypothetical protein n=1 Tax=Streptomyces yerevanensis TaxID=66378 RepID=UPI000A72951B
MLTEAGICSGPSSIDGHIRERLLAQKCIGEDRCPWLLPGEQRVMLLIEPTRVRHVLGVERFRPGVLPEGSA